MDYLQGLRDYSYKGNIDLNKRKVLKDGGDIKTENSITIGADGKHIIIPTVVDGVQLSEDDAIDHFFDTGEHLGMYDDAAQADKMANNIHIRQGNYYNGDSPVDVNADGFDMSRTMQYKLEAPMMGTDPFTADLSGDMTMVSDPVNPEYRDVPTTPAAYNRESFMTKLYDTETRGGKLADRPGSTYRGIAQISEENRTPILSELGYTEEEYLGSQAIQKEVANSWIGGLEDRLDRNGFELSEFNMWAAHNQGVGGMNQIIHDKVNDEVLGNIRGQAGMNKTSTTDDYIAYYSKIFSK